MAANYPGSVYSPRTKENKAGEVYNASKKTIVFSEDVVKLDEEVVAIETELGANPKGASASVARKIKGIRSLLDVTNVLLVIGDAASALTNYVRIKLSGQLQLYGTARVVRHLLMDPKRFKMPAANFPGESFEGLFYTLDFDKNTEQSANTQENIPYRWDSNTDIEMHVRWLHDNADAGAVVWGLEYKAIKAGEAVAGAGTIITQASAGNHTAGEMVDTTFASKILAANLETHDEIAIRFFRKAADGADTLAEDARALQILFHFTENKLGKPI